MSWKSIFTSQLLATQTAGQSLELIISIFSSILHTDTPHPKYWYFYDNNNNNMYIFEEWKSIYTYYHHHYYYYKNINTLGRVSTRNDELCSRQLKILIKINDSSRRIFRALNLSLSQRQATCYTRKLTSKLNVKDHWAVGQFNGTC